MAHTMIRARHSVNQVVARPQHNCIHVGCQTFCSNPNNSYINSIVLLQCVALCASPLQPKPRSVYLSVALRRHLKLRLVKLVYMTPPLYFVGGLGFVLGQGGLDPARHSAMAGFFATCLSVTATARLPPTTLSACSMLFFATAAGRFMHFLFFLPFIITLFESLHRHLLELRNGDTWFLLI